MNFRNTNTYNYNLKNSNVDIRGYMILEKVPQELYKEVYDWSLNEIDLSKMAISVSDGEAKKTMLVDIKPAVVLDGIGMCEVELRGALLDLTIEGHKSITLSTSFVPVLHYSNGIYSMTMLLPSKYQEALNTMLESVIPKLDSVFEEVVLSEDFVEVDQTWSLPITTVQDAITYNEDTVHNIVTTPFTYK